MLALGLFLTDLVCLWRDYHKRARKLTNFLWSLNVILTYILPVINDNVSSKLPNINDMINSFQSIIKV